MNYRRILYIAFIVFIAFFFFRNLGNNNTIDKQIQSIPRASVMDLILDDPELNKDTKTIYFPLDYKGTAGEVFYVSTENDDGPITYKYRIEEIEAAAVNELEFELDQTWEGIKIPADKFDAFCLEDGQWVEM